MKSFCQHCAKEWTPRKTLNVGNFGSTAIIVPLGMHDCKETKEYLAARKRYAQKQRYA